jgi:para-nitrobenzyl esterase
VNELEIRTAQGVVRGRREGAVAVFRGIPYAQPPVGPLRFRAPVPARPWDGVRDALRFGPVPPSRQAEDGGSGDWLTLTVWSPDLGTAGLPVMVWICGGAYLHCDSSNPHCDGAALAAAGAVVVSMNYRVGVEGFAHLTGAPDNRGILDQVAALRWVHDNIDAFGGAPGNVTVFGQSAGAGSTAALLTMPEAAGLFRRAIAQSVPGTYFSTRLAADVSATIAAEVGARATVDDLADLAPRELVRATDAVIRTMRDRSGVWGPMTRTPTPFSPVVDGDVLPQAPWPALADGAARDVDLLVGHTRDEYRLLAAGRDGEVTAEQATAALESLAPGQGAATAYRSAYPDATPATLHELVHADWLMRMPSLHLAEAQHAGGGRAWTYELVWGPGPAGASHSLDVLLVFGTVDDDVLRHAPNAADEAAHLARVMRAEWLRFATTGDPGWPAHAPDDRATRVYDAEPSTLPYPEEASRRIWQEHRFDILDLIT